MPTESYYLPCACGVRSIVDASQCGRQLNCQCGRTLEVPPLRGLRQLDRVELKSSRSGASSWNPARGLALVALVPLIGAVAYGAFVYSQVPAPLPPYPKLEGRNPREILYQDWFPLVERGIDDSFLPVVQKYIDAVNRRRDALMATGVVAGLSLLGVIIGLLWPARRPAPTPKPAPPRRPAA